MKLSDLKNGAVVELRNGWRCLKVDNTFLNLDDFGGFMEVDCYKPNMKRHSGCGDYDIVKVNNNTKNKNGYCNLALTQACNGIWTWERPTEILTEDEKEKIRHLVEALKPFKIERIWKTDASRTEWLQVDGGGAIGESIALPSFDTESMFSGMELYEQYTLKDLGIEEE